MRNEKDEASQFHETSGGWGFKLAVCGDLRVVTYLLLLMEPGCRLLDSNVLKPSLWERDEEDTSHVLDARDLSL